MSKQDEIHLFLEQARERFTFSAYQVFADNARSVHEWCGGVQSYWDPTAISSATCFDLGSVTKAVVTTSLFARAVDARMVALDQKVEDWVDEWKGTPVGGLVLGALLCHASGLAPWFPIYQSTLAQEGLRPWVRKRGAEWIEAPPGIRTAYSDLGFLILGEVLKEIWKKDLALAFREEVTGPLGVQDVRFGPLPEGCAVAATEVRRGVPLSGVVFDENSEALGGVTPHAGLFATAKGLAPWCRGWLDAVQGKSRWLTQETACLFVARTNRVAGSSWALGWDTKSAKDSSAGEFFSETSFGHLGYPGTSVWIDPKSGGFVIFLSNRVHPSRLDDRIGKVRPALHNAVASLWARGG